MRLIDADAVLRIIEEIKSNKDIPKNYGTLLDISRKIRSLPTIDAEPVIHGHWVENRDRAELQLICSQCGYDYIEADPDCIERHNFCPHCGAKMDEEAVQ